MCFFLLAVVVVVAATVFFLELAAAGLVAIMSKLELLQVLLLILL
jgi:hypothetical protein